MLVKIDAIIQEDKFEDVKKALNEIHINGMTVSQVMGCGIQHGYTRKVRGQDVAITLLPKIKLEIVVSSEEWEAKVVDTIREAAYSGNMGDGKIFTYAIRHARKIRTNEIDEEAIWSAKKP